MKHGDIYQCGDQVRTVVAIDPGIVGFTLGADSEETVHWQTRFAFAKSCVLIGEAYQALGGVVGSPDRVHIQYQTRDGKP